MTSSTPSATNTRRDFLKTSTAALATASLPYWFTSATPAEAAYRSANERPVVGCIGTGSRWGGVGPQAMRFGDVAAVCDVDTAHAKRGQDRVKRTQKKDGKEPTVDVYGDYRKILDRKDIDVVTIVTPDHWHTKIAIEAMKAGKDIYCEKPLTLTIEEGRQIITVLDKTKRVFQVGTQQRTEMGRRFLKAIALVHDGRIGKVNKVTCDIGGSPKSGPLKVEPVPENLNWDMWQGQTPEVDYIKRRCHYQFRWWYEYSGGKLTDWGAHHVDIAQWAIQQNGPGQGPMTVKPVVAEHPVPFKDGNPTVPNEYNCSHNFHLQCDFPDGVEMNIVSKSKDGNGILFEGSKGRFFVSRGKIVGAPVDELKTNPLPEDAIVKVYRGKKPTSHMQNFFDCVKSRELPISDVYTHHQALTTCHLANIALRLGRSLKWDAKTNTITGDPEANKWQGREQRKGYEIKV